MKKSQCSRFFQREADALHKDGRGFTFCDYVTIRIRPAHEMTALFELGPTQLENRVFVRKDYSQIECLEFGFSVKTVWVMKSQWEEEKGWVMGNSLQI